MTEDIVQARAKDGSTVEFIYRDPAQGAVKDVYFAPDKSYVVAFFRKPLRPEGKDRVDMIVNKYREQIFNEVGGEYWKKLFCWPEKIVECDGKTGIVVPAYAPCFFFKNGMLAGSEKEGKWFASAKNFNRFVPPEEKGTLIEYLRICLNLSRGVRRLHAAGLAHSDLSYKNCLVDPSSGNACIIDIDGLVVPGKFPPDVFGTPDFIAPEVVKTMGGPADQRALPKRTTDQHALAVLIYLYLLHRHPLRGGKVHSQDNDVQEKMEMGERALFIEHPQDRSNRPKLSKNDDVCRPWVDPDKLPYTILGPYLKTLFDQAFITGLFEPSQRPSAEDWEDAIFKTTDLIQPCENPSCPKKWFVFDNSRNPRCPYCGTPYKKQLPLLDFYVSYNEKYRSENRRMMVWDGQSLYEWHVDRMVMPNEKLKPEQLKRVGYFSFFKGKWYLVNETAPDMYDVTHNRPIPTDSKVALETGLQILLSKRKTGRLALVTLVNG